MEEQGIRIRPICGQNLESDLKKIYAIVSIAFRANPYYVQIDESDFLEMYLPIGPTIEPDFVLLAERGEEIIGFCFAVPDLLQARRGELIDTIVVKTFGVLPQPGYGGVGQVLLEEVHHRAAAHGYRHAIHALVREAAPSMRIVGRYGSPFRRYALFAKELSR